MTPPRASDQPDTLYRGAVFDSPTHPGASAMLVRAGQIAWLGPETDAPTGGVPIVDLREYGPAVVLPAFVDAHVHATMTGLTITGLDLSECDSPAGVVAAVCQYAREHPGEPIIGHGADPAQWHGGDAVELVDVEKAVPGAAVYLARVDMHSAVASHSLRERVPGLAHMSGFHETGPLSQQAHEAVRREAFTGLSEAQRTDAQRAALDRAARLGIGAVHECGGPIIGGEADFVSLLSLAHSQPGVDVYGLWGETDAGKAKELGAVAAGGDIFLDGSLGSYTAHLREPYVGAPPHASHTGVGYLGPDEVAAHVIECIRHEIAAGFHAIGDAAIQTLLDGYAKAAATIGVTAIREGRHRIEHAQVLDAKLISGIVNFGLTASVQPGFDARWGGPNGMYAQRLGTQRAASVLPLSALLAVGVPMAFGSDSPATSLGPWRGLHAAVHHTNPRHALSPRAAFTAHTRGGWRSLGFDGVGVLVPGAPATFAVWQTQDAIASAHQFLTEVTSSDDLTEPPCLATVVRGEHIYDVRDSGARSRRQRSSPVGADVRQWGLTGFSNDNDQRGR